jgi:hypothetical protein
MGWAIQAVMGYADLTLVWQNSTMGSSYEDLCATLFTPVWKNSTMGSGCEAN